MADQATNGKLRVGIAGYGVVGQRRHHFIKENPVLETIAVCDRKFESAGQFDNGIRYYTNYHDLLKEEIDVLFVCLTNDINPDATIDGLKLGLHVFCEKPPGRNVKDIKRVIDCEKTHSNLKLMYGFNHRYHNSVRDALALTRSGELGKVINIRGVYGKSKFISYGQPSSWRTHRDIAGGGILLDQGIHMVDLMRLFAGEFVDVYSFVSNGYWNYDVEDNAYALMRTGDGVIAMLHSTATQWRHRFNMDVTLERGALIMSGILTGSKSYGTETLVVARAADDDQGDPDETVTSYDHDHSWASEIADFADAILEDRPVQHGSSTDALKTMGLVYRIYCADPEWRARWNLTPEKPQTQEMD
jgi:predicted dehydrogenase